MEKLKKSVIAKCYTHKPVENGMIGDMIKRNESDVADIVFEIMAKKEIKFFCFTLFLVLINCS